MLIILLGAAPGCARQSEITPDDRAIHELVRAYNAALIEAFVSLDMNELNTVATEEQAYTEFYLMAALGEGRVVMHSTLVSIEFGEVTFTAEDQASVTTTEVWDYEHVSLDTSETVRTESGIIYHLRYDLVLQDGRWLVDGVTSLDETGESQETTP